jgi:hypothetical protein
MGRRPKHTNATRRSLRSLHAFADTPSSALAGLNAYPSSRHHRLWRRPASIVDHLAAFAGNNCFGGNRCPCQLTKPLSGLRACMKSPPRSRVGIKGHQSNLRHSELEQRTPGTRNPVENPLQSCTHIHDQVDFAPMRSLSEARVLALKGMKEGLQVGQSKVYARLARNVRSKSELVRRITGSQKAIPCCRLLAEGGRLNGIAATLRIQPDKGMLSRVRGRRR